MIKFLRGNVASLPATATEGAIYFTKDEGLYLGLSDGSFHRYGDFIQVANVDSLPATGANVKALYYAINENILCRYTGTEWVQINKQPTAAEMKVLLGLGSAAYQDTSAFDAAGSATGALNAAKAYTDTEIGDLGENYATVKAYVDAKTDGIASSEALGALNDRVTTAEGEIDALQAAVGEGGSVDTKIENAINALDHIDTAVTGEYVSAVSEENGKISVTRTALPDYSETYDAKGAAAAVQSALDSYKTTNDTAVGKAQGAADTAQAGVDAIKADYLKAADKTALEEAIALKADQTALNSATGRISAIEADYLKAVDKTALQGSIDAIDGRVETLETTIQDLTGAMHFEGVVESDPTAEGFDVSGYVAGDVVVFGDKEFVFHSGAFHELGDVSAEGTRLSALEATMKTEQANIDTLQSEMDAVEAKAAANENAISAIKDDENIDSFADVVAELAKKQNTIPANTYDAYGSAATAETNAKNYADGLKTTIDAAYAAADGTTLQSAKDYADGLAVNYDAKGSADTAESNAKSYADQKIAALDKSDAAVAGQYVSAVSEEDGIITVERASLPDYSETYDAKGAAATALSDAKSYTDQQIEAALTWGEF